MTMQELIKVFAFYLRFTPSYTGIGYVARGLPFKSYEKDFQGQRWLVTGASGGLGKALLRAGVAGGAKVLAVARSADKLAAAVGELPADKQDLVTVKVADMALQSSTQALLDDLVSQSKTFDVLMNNVGVLNTELIVTKEGREASYVTNILSHFLLTEGLAKHGLFASNATIVNMTSGGMYGAPLGTALLDVTDPKTYSGKVAYAFSKRGQAALTGYWNETLGPKGISSYVVHPGWARTEGVKRSLPVFWKIQNLILRSPAQGADTAVWLAATRPAVVAEEHVWFDRKDRTAHMFEHSRTPQCTVQELVDYLQADLDRGTGKPQEVASS